MVEQHAKLLLNKGGGILYASLEYTKGTTWLDYRANKKKKIAID